MLMPQSKQMKLQWLTIDGRNVPFALPQHWNGDDWTITGVDNPLPTANYIEKNGIMVPVSENNPVPTQLTGSIVEIHELLKGEVIPPHSRLDFLITFKGKSFGFNGRWENNLPPEVSESVEADYYPNEYKSSGARPIGRIVDLEVSGSYILSTDGERISLTSPTVRFRIRNNSEEEIELRHVFITEYL